MSSSSNVENAQLQVLRQMLRDLCDLVHQLLPVAIRLIGNEEDVTDIEATIEGPLGAPYVGGVFQPSVVPPKGMPDAGVLHDGNLRSKCGCALGRIRVNALKKDWKPDLGLQQVLLTIKCLLIARNPESALNEDAGRMLLEKYGDQDCRERIRTGTGMLDRIQSFSEYLKSSSQL